MNFDAKLKNFRSMVDKALEYYLPPSDAYPPLIHQAMRYSILGGGKRLRAVLLMAATETVGGEVEKVLPAACALEMIHAYSLIHDDLPAMDNDDYRRGKPANHKVYGEAVAILAGDALLTQAFSLLASMRGNKPESVVRVIGEFALAAGSCGMIGGQVVDTFSAGNNGEDMAENTLEYIHSHKTGALYRAAACAGAILAGASDEKTDSLARYADGLGLAFQIIDDILDIEGDASKLGKPVGSDVKNEKITYPLLYGIDESKRKAAETVDKALSALDSFDKEADFLRILVKRMVKRNY